MNAYNNFMDDDLLLNLSSPSLLIIEDSALAKSLSSIISRDGIDKLKSKSSSIKLNII